MPSNFLTRPVRKLIGELAIELVAYELWRRNHSVRPSARFAMEMHAMRAVEQAIEQEIAAIVEHYNLPDPVRETPASGPPKEGV